MWLAADAVGRSLKARTASAHARGASGHGLRERACCTAVRTYSSTSLRPYVVSAGWLAVWRHRMPGRPPA
jgi:hypothetical protein